MNIEQKLITRKVEIVPGLMLTVKFKLTKNEIGLVKAKLLEPSNNTKEMVLAWHLIGDYNNKLNTWFFKINTTEGEQIYNNNN